jgi:hypothetical protein
MKFTFELLNKLNLTSGEWVIIKYQGREGYYNGQISSSSGNKDKPIFEEDIEHLYIQFPYNSLSNPTKLKINKIEYFFQVKENYYPIYEIGHIKSLICNKKIEDINVDCPQNKDKPKKELLELLICINALCLMKSYGKFNLLEKDRHYEILKTNGEVMNILFEKNEIESDDDRYKFFIYYFDNNNIRKKISHFDIIKFNKV